MAALRIIGKKHGIEIENAAARVMRSRPFNPVRGMLGADGQRWVPIHAVFPLSEAERVVDANAAFFKSKEAMMKQHGIIVSHLTMTVGNEFFLEPAFYWPDEITPLHRKSLGDDVVGPWLSRPANVPAREAVIALRKDTQQLYLSLGGVNWQIGRDYPLQQVMQPEIVESADCAEARARSARPHEPGLAGPAHRRPEAFFDTFSEPNAMGFTITEKILARTAGLPFVKAGDEIMAKPDFVLAYDFPGYTDVIFKQLKNDFGITKMAEPERFGIFIDHMVPGDHPGRRRAAQGHARVDGDQ